MTAPLSFEVPGRPVSWQRSNDVRGRRVTDAAQRAAKRVYAAAALAARPRGWPLDRTYAVEVIGYYPDRRYADSDRLVGLVLDALEGVAYRTDRQVGVQAGLRCLVPKGEERIAVTVVPYDEGDHVEVTIAIGRAPCES